MATSGTTGDPFISGFQGAGTGNDPFISGFQGAAPPGPWDNLKANLVKNLPMMLGPGGMLLGGVANTAAGGEYSPAEILSHGFTQGLDESAVAAAKAVGQSIGRGTSFSDNYASALNDIQQRREAGQQPYGVAGKIAGGVASAIPYAATGGALAPESLLGKLAVGTGTGVVSGGLQGFGQGTLGNQLASAKQGAIVGGVLGLGTTAAGLAAAKAWQAFRGPISSGQAGAQWLRTTGAFDGPIEDYEENLTRQLAKRPEGSALITAQVADERLAKDLAKKAAKDPRALAKLEEAAQFHSDMAQPYYESAKPQLVQLNNVQAALMNQVPEINSAYKGAAWTFGQNGSGKYALPDEIAPGQQVPVEVMDYIKKRVDGAVTKLINAGTRTNNPAPNYNETENLKMFRDALIGPVKQAVPDYAKATDIASVSQFLRGAVIAGKMAKNSAAVADAPGALPNPMPEATVGLFSTLLHGNPSTAASIYGLRAAANMARRATGASASKALASGVELMLEPAASGVQKLGWAATHPTTPGLSGLPAVLGALGGAGGVAFVPEDSSR